jgi:hypothetical protein
MKPIKITVTKDDLKRAVRNSTDACSECIVAVAVRRHGWPRAIVTANTVALHPKSATLGPVMYLDDAGRYLVRMFDSSLPVEHLLPMDIILS